MKFFLLSLTTICSIALALLLSMMPVLPYLKGTMGYVLLWPMMFWMYAWPIFLCGLFGNDSFPKPDYYIRQKSFSSSLAAALFVADFLEYGAALVVVFVS